MFLFNYSFPGIPPPSTFPFSWTVSLVFTQRICYNHSNGNSKGIKVSDRNNQQQHTTPNGICSKVHFGNAQKSTISILGEAFSYGELMVSMKLMQLTWPDRTTGQIENVGQMKCNRKLY